MDRASDVLAGQVFGALGLVAQGRRWLVTTRAARVLQLCRRMQVTTSSRTDRVQYGTGPMRWLSTLATRRLSERAGEKFAIGSVRSAPPHGKERRGRAFGVHIFKLCGKEDWQHVVVHWGMWNGKKRGMRASSRRGAPRARARGSRLAARGRMRLADGNVRRENTRRGPVGLEGRRRARPRKKPRRPRRPRRRPRPRRTRGRRRSPKCRRRSTAAAAGCRTRS